MTTPNRLLYRHSAVRARVILTKVHCCSLESRLLSGKRYAEWLCWHASIFTPVLENTRALETERNMFRLWLRAALPEWKKFTV